MNTFLFFKYGNRMTIFLSLFSKIVQILKTNCKYSQYCIPLTQSHCRYFFVLAISISYRTVSSTIWPIFPKSLIFCWLICLLASEIKQNMRNKENIGHIVRDERGITSLSLSWKISAFCYCNLTFIKGQKHNYKFLSPSNH